MVKGDERVFDDIYQAKEYILGLEKARLSADPLRKTPPMICDPFLGFTSLEEIDLKPTDWDSLDYPFVAYFNNAEDSKFIMNKLASGRYSLKPNLRNRKFLFRGETEFHNPCKPSLFRDAEKDYFLDSLIYTHEMYRLILSHPLVQLLDLGVILNGKHIRFEMNLYGLTQHYYNQSSLLDLTSDIDVALFFATQSYDRETDTYSPITDEKHTEGVLYYYDFDFSRDFLEPPCGEYISTVGLQVFPRSGRQKGFLYNCPKDRNFNDLEQLQAIKFKHNAKIAREIYEKMERGDLLFPRDILQLHWQGTHSPPNTVSSDAVRINQMINDDESFESIKEKLESYGIRVADYKPTLTKEELHEYYEAMKDKQFWINFCNQIHIPGDSEGKMMEALRNVPYQPEYKWAFEEGIPHKIDYDKGFILKHFKHILE